MNQLRLTRTLLVFTRGYRRDTSQGIAFPLVNPGEGRFPGMKATGLARVTVDTVVRGFQFSHLIHLQSPSS